MAVLTDASRREIWAKWMRENEDPVSIVKSDLRAAFNALDDFMNTNATAVNNAIPEPAKSSLSTPQKARILMEVIRQRFVKGS